MLSHVLFGKPASTFPGHALKRRTATSKAGQQIERLNSPLRRRWPNRPHSPSRAERPLNRACDILRSGAWLTPERIRLVAVAISACVRGRHRLHAGHRQWPRRYARPPAGNGFLKLLCRRNLRSRGQRARPRTTLPGNMPASRRSSAWRHRSIAGSIRRSFFSSPPRWRCLPYGAALAAWQAVTLGFISWRSARFVSPSPRLRREGRDECASPRGSESWTALLLAVAFPAVLVNLGHGQNGFLTAALLGGALAMLDRRPIVAGILFGLLAYKPQFGLMIPLVLGGGRALARFRRRGGDNRVPRVGGHSRFRPGRVAGIPRHRPTSLASSCSNRAIPAGTRCKACSPGRACGAHRFRWPTLCKACSWRASSLH